MVITSPFSSIRGVVATKPPLVLFTLCLIAFAITTFTFAYYVEHKNDLPNIDAQKDWESFLAYLSNRKLCVTPSEAPLLPAKIASNENETGDLINIFVKATLNYSLIPNVTNVQGNVYTEDWISQCPMTVPVNVIKVSFKVSQHANNTYYGDNDVCVMITGPKELLSPAETNQCKAPTGSPHISWGQLKDTKAHGAKPSCADGTLTSLTFIPGSYNAMLSLHDRSIINLHLFHTSYFMLVMAITLICYAMIKGKPAVKHQQFEKIMTEA